MWIQLAVKGLLIAMIPLIFVKLSKDQDKYRKLAWVILFLTFDLIMFGAFTRLTDSGLGCPDWPGCYGESNPFLAHDEISAAQAAMPTGPVTVVKAWIEMIHRYLAMAVGVLIIGLVIYAWRGWLASKKTDLKYRPVMPMVLLALVCLQGAFGAWTVTLRLQPIIVTIHLLLALVLLGMLTWVCARLSPQATVTPLARKLVVPATIGTILLVIQIALGGWVSTNYAALACTDFPLCHGELIPTMDYQHGYSLWRHLGKTASGDYLPFEALTAIHWTHRMFALVVFVFLVGLGIAAHKDAGLRKTARAILLVVVVQCLTGIATVYFNWPLAIAVIHNGGAALLILLLIMLNYKARYAPTTSSLHVV